ncbi:DUF1127 domain-containing protein [Marinobacterium arenosum]|uniref:DUF1127 domain-containing protein n=1 Tax=Marinobacterium arenosum TaxID=2862496 RepID=UPI001C9727F6|nr:DUF1127 domain-containing protein [Marinobacterium arenosum]MBY4675427.1 DUF1127 domain-containing protein [Marinobacterium arenosum]
MSCTVSNCQTPATKLSLASLIKGYWRAWRRQLCRWRRNSHGRHQLAQLDDRLLRDIGLSRHDAEQISRKPFWRE